jgi:ankyrin repeat protein
MAKEKKAPKDKPPAGKKEFARLSTLARAGKLDEVKELLSSLNITQPPHESLAGSLFFALTHKRDIEIVDLFFSKGVDPNVRWTRFTPLTAAAMCSDPNFVAMMLERGCDINYPAANGDSPLIASGLRGSENRNPAVRRGQEDVARLLIEKGANVNHANDEGKTALDYACQAIAPTWEPMITLLLDAGARLEVKLIGVRSVHLQCDYDELGEFVWERI